MTDSSLLSLLRQLQQELHQEVARAVYAALAQYPGQPATPVSMAESPVLLNVREAAAFLQVSVATVHAWKRQGLIVYRKIGNRTLFERTALLAAAAPQRPTCDGRRATPRRKAGRSSALKF